MRKLRCRRVYACPSSHSVGGTEILALLTLGGARGSHPHCSTKPSVGCRDAAVAPIPEEESAEMSHTQRRSSLPIVLHRTSHECLQRPQKLCLVLSALQGPARSQVRAQRCPSRPARAQPPLHLRKGCGRRRPALRRARGSVGEDLGPGFGLSLSVTLILRGLPTFPHSNSSRGQLKVAFARGLALFRLLLRAVPPQAPPTTIQPPDRVVRPQAPPPCQPAAIGSSLLGTQIHLQLSRSSQIHPPLGAPKSLRPQRLASFSRFLRPPS